MSDRGSDIADRLRGRILRGLHAGTIDPGDRLPSSRELAQEFEVDHRVVLGAYRMLAAEGTVELRPRGGIYVARQEGEPVVPLPSSSWISEILAQGVNREIPIVELHDWMRRSVETLRLRAVVIQRTTDQVSGLCRELRDYYGLEATGIEGEVLEEMPDLPVDLRYADVLVTTAAYREVARELAERLDKQLIVVEVRPDLIGGEWRLLLKKPVFVIVNDEKFVSVLQHFFADTEGAQNIRPLVVGRDSLESIPEGASVYVTNSAREQLGGQPLRGRILPSARLLSTASGLEVIRFIVEANFRALAAVRKDR